MTRDAIVETIKAAAVGGRLTCGKAHDLAEELNTSLREIGSICNELKIKIAACQLGCF